VADIENWLFEFKIGNGNFGGYKLLINTGSFDLAIGVAINYMTIVYHHL